MMCPRKSTTTKVCSWCESLSIVVCIFLVHCLSVTQGFNLDTHNYAQYGGHSRSMFGFSVATHRVRGQSWVLIGAPEAQSSQPHVERGGSVYRCQSNSDNTNCAEVPFDTKGSNIDQNQTPIDSKSHQWFGATLQSAGEDGPVVACAPRYIYFGTKGDRRDPVGTCYVSSADFTTYAEYSPCRTRYFGYHRQGSCQAGFSAALTNDGNRLFVGAPGSYYWQGQIYSIDANATFPYHPGIFTNGAFGSGQVIQQSLEKRPPVVSTNEGELYEDDSYMGYSMAVGDFTGDGEQGVAVGKPRGARLLGQINLFTWNLTNYQNISLGEYGHQIGTYFGYCVAAADVDGDQTDDLIVGAPLHVEPNNEDNYEVGRVYVIYQGKEPTNRFRRFNTLDGFKSKSRFGLSLTSLGDINMDGFDDFAVGAPYDGPNERGAVYIYHGAKSLVDAKYSQVIYSEDVSQGMPINTFGFSLAGGVDLDGNEYPDMAVGAYLSDVAFLFRARPVVKIESKVAFANKNKKIVLEEKNCTLRNHQKVSCARIDICMRFHGKGVPTTINLDVQYVLDGKKAKDPRMFFMSPQDEDKTTLHENIRLFKDQQMVCQQKMVYIKNEIRDKLTALEVEVKYSMKEAESHYQHQRDPSIPLHPILDPNNKQMNKDSLTIHKNCGPDNICIPNLKLEVNSNVERFLLGSNDKLEFDVVVRNLGEDSFESTFDMHLPEGIYFNKIVQTDKTEVRILCSEAENNTIKCDIGNPLPANKIARFKVLMGTAHHKEGMRPSYDFLMLVNSTNPEITNTVFDNRIEKSIPIWVNSQLELSGTSKPSEVHYNASHYISEKIMNESDIGPQVIHLYSVKNNGPSSINEAEVVFLWPYATLSGDDLLYLLEQPHILGNMKCEIAEANYRGYDLDVRKKSIWESLGITQSEFFGMSQAGGLTIMEGPGTHGSTPKDFNTRVLTEEERRRKLTETSGGIAGGSGTVVSVGKDTGRGSAVSETRVTEGWTQNGTTYYRNITGGGVRITQTQTSGSSSSGSSGSSGFSESSGSSGQFAGAGGQYGHHGGTFTSSSSSSRGGSSSNTGGLDEGYSSGGSDTHTNVIYTTGGKKPSTSGISLASSGTSSSGSSYSSSSGTNIDGGQVDASSYIENRNSGQDINASEGGHTEYNTGTYRLNKTTSVNKHFDWNSGTTRNHSTSGRPSASSADIYEENRQFYDRRRQEEEERIRIEETRRIQEHERRLQEEKHRKQEAERRAMERQRQEEARRRADAERRRPSDEERIHLEAELRRKEEERIRVEEYHRLLEARRVEEERRADEERRRVYEATLQARRIEEERRKTYEHHVTATAATHHSSSSSSSSQGKFDFPYSEEVYTGSDENYNYDDNRHESQGGSYNRSYSSSRGHTQYGSAGGQTQYSSGSGQSQHATSGGQANAGHGGYVHGSSSGGGFGEAAASGGGFRTTTLDLGTLAHGQAQAQGHGQSASGNRQWETRSESSWSAHGTGAIPEHLGRDNVATDRPNYENRFHGRRRRDSDQDKDIKEFMKCQSSKCLAIRCTVGPLLKDQSVLVALRSRVNVRTLRNISTSQSINFSSMMLARIDKLPYIGRPLNRTVHSHEIFTTVAAPEPDIKPYIVPLWVIVLSAVGGTILLLLLIYLLHKLGFFKRNRPSDAPERQPLNRNAYYNGDQAL